MTLSVAARLKMAVQHHGNNRLDAAEKLYQEVLGESPDNPDALQLLGVLKHQQGDAAGGETLIRRAIAVKSDQPGYWNNLGNVLAAQGKLVESASAYDQAVRLKPDDALAFLNLGYVLRAAGRNDAAIEKYRRAVELQPNFAEAHGKLGVALTQENKLTDAARHFRKALELKPDYVEARASLGNLLRAEGQLEEAALHFQHVLKAQPEFAEIHHALGMVRRQEGKLNEAAEHLRRAVTIRGDYAEAHHALGELRLQQGRTDEARKSFKRALEADPQYPEALSHLGVLMRRRGQAKDAAANFERALKIRPDFVEAQLNLGMALLDLGKCNAAEPYLERAMELRPDHPDAVHNLALLRHMQNRHDVAEMLYRRALELRPAFPESLTGLGTVLKDRGQLDEAMRLLRRALELRPDYTEAHTGLIFTLDFVPSAGVAEQQAERRRWFERFGRTYAAAVASHDHDRDPERRLRVGYVSANFCRHSAVYSFGPVLRNHDRTQFEVTCYSAVSMEDDVTAELRAHADRWRPILSLTDEQIAAQIRDDQIDILIDLSGHSYGNRLLVFARKPAPVQVTAWGHATGTGLPTIDYLFADSTIVPADVRSHFAETIYDLPCAISYEAPPYAPAVAPLPASQDGLLTFASLNRLSKMSDGTLALWARLLAALPHSRLLLKDRQLNSLSERERILGGFAGLGIGPERLMLQGGSPHAEHLAAFSQVDIALDPFPQNGGISTFEALWMGVPVIALAGHTVPSRIGASILTAAGLVDWVASDEDEYVAIALRNSADRQALAALRGGLRTKLAGSAAGNAKLYTEIVEQAYRTMWRRWCAGGPQPSCA
jgi:protein O-GlcNAc transferase